MKVLLVLSCLSFSLLANDCIVRRAAFDIGSGTTKMKVYDYNKCEKKVVEKIKNVGETDCELYRKISFKEDLKKSDKIQKSTISKGTNSLRKLKNFAVQCGATEFSGVATSAFRQANNGQETANALMNSGIKIRIISHDEEARLGFVGAKSEAKFEGNKLCVWDIGGSSMQIICKNGERSESYLGKLAAVSFKNKVIKSQNKTFFGLAHKKNYKDIKSPNPMSLDDYAKARKIARKEARKVSKELKAMLQESTVLGIGGVHYFAIGKEIDKKEYLASDVEEGVFSSLELTDKELGGGKYVDTAVTNMILVEEFMRTLKLKSVKSYKVNLTEGIVVSDKYWN